MPHSTSKCIFLAPAPRIASDIFDENDLLRLRAIGVVVIHEVGPVTDGIFEDRAAKAEIIIGQIDLPESRLKQIGTTCVGCAPLGLWLFTKSAPSQMESLKTEPRRQKSSSVRLTCLNHA